MNYSSDTHTIYTLTSNVMKNEEDEQSEIISSQTGTILYPGTARWLHMVFYVSYFIIFIISRVKICQLFLDDRPRTLVMNSSVSHAIYF